jgi:hypothetical protein
MFSRQFILLCLYFAKEPHRKRHLLGREELIEKWAWYCLMVLSAWWPVTFCWDMHAMSNIYFKTKKFRNF